MSRSLISLPSTVGRHTPWRPDSPWSSLYNNERKSNYKLERDHTHTQRKQMIAQRKTAIAKILQLQHKNDTSTKHRCQKFWACLSAFRRLVRLRAAVSPSTARPESPAVTLFDPQSRNWSCLTLPFDGSFVLHRCQSLDSG